MEYPWGEPNYIIDQSELFLLCVDKVVDPINDNERLERLMSCLIEQGALSQAIILHSLGIPYQLDFPMMHIVGWNQSTSDGDDDGTEITFTKRITSTILHEITSFTTAESIEVLLNEPEIAALINNANGDDFTPLGIAIRCGNVDVAEVLLKHGADPSLLSTSIPTWINSIHKVIQQKWNGKLVEVNSPDALELYLKLISSIPTQENLEQYFKFTPPKPNPNIYPQITPTIDPAHYPPITTCFYSHNTINELNTVLYLPLLIHYGANPLEPHPKIDGDLIKTNMSQYQRESDPFSWTAGDTKVLSPSAAPTQNLIMFLSSQFGYNYSLHPSQYKPQLLPEVILESLVVELMDLLLSETEFEWMRTHNINNAKKPN